ncbi:biotin--[acetyl-CoA-carboxylase] ligase [Gleimia sp. 6138-11-ORH1]|uniref:biotin--[acetyl-CoA-carboxylase] ligase n=1 Tax=Gleimia sp. 6138-11-ORH1 TaxID=2973937 RepID=UPI00216703F7|nr:biotin--[acetyl-CoA-carboxylase] ligase [Gleimia sp. 6138-11-ORH1]MCS4484607.1 biotin--[acetyl-CoA-carboxylase] ligase [Gleimia sp. 6138-11-ORH1]
MPKEIFFCPVLDSTQLEAQRRLHSSYLTSAPGVLYHVATGHQTAGRGRFTRNWEDLPQTCSLSSTVVKLPQTALKNAHWLTIIAALSVVETVHGFFPHTQSSLKLKWPNDVLFQGAKLGGVLATVLPTTDPQYAYISLGVGVNLLQESSHLPTPTAISLKAAKLTPLPKVKQFNQEFFEILNQNLEIFVKANWESDFFQAPYQSLLSGIGELVEVTHLSSEAPNSNAETAGSKSPNTYTATFLGISPNGWAQLQPAASPDTIIEVSSADITFSPNSPENFPSTQPLSAPLTPDLQEVK